ncbi:hypothetical protein ANO11243_073250 [Dothideomycetidae sp. 11243]|nr:hypothetical protein ANO11243_073250 [fungal sp. No.11243]
MIDLGFRRYEIAGSSRCPHCRRIRGSRDPSSSQFRARLHSIVNGLGLLLLLLQLRILAAAAATAPAPAPGSRAGGFGGAQFVEGVQSLCRPRLAVSSLAFASAPRVSPRCHGLVISSRASGMSMSEMGRARARLLEGSGPVTDQHTGRGR